MKYMLLIYNNQAEVPQFIPEERQAAAQAWFAFGAEAQAAGVLRFNDGLAPVTDATTVRVRDGKTLMLLHDSRRAARQDAAGNLVLLEEQDRSRWSAEQIREGTAALDSALALGNPGPYQVQAAISALHAEAATSDVTDWKQIAALYGALAKMTPSPVVEVNRAVAVAMAVGAALGLARLLRLDDQMDDYYPYHAARADLLRRTNQREAAADAYERALALCGNPAERAYLQRRLDEMLHTSL